MNRWLFRGNAALFVCLVALLIVNARAAFARGAGLAPGSLARETIRWVVLNTGLRPAGVIDFGTLMVPLERLEDPVPPGLVALEPSAPVSLRWSSPSQLRIDALEPLARATTYHVHLAPSLRTLDGRALDPELALAFDTDRVRIEQLTADEDEAGAFVALAFDLPVAAAAVQKALSVEDETGVAVPHRLVEPRPATKSRSAFQIRLEKMPSDAIVVRLDQRLAPLGKSLDLGQSHEIAVLGGR